MRAILRDVVAGDSLGGVEGSTTARVRVAPSRAAWYLLGVMRSLFFVLLPAILAPCACSSSSPPADTRVPQVGPTSGIDAGDPDVRRRARFLTDLTLDERKQLCDWTAAIGGGYGKVTACEGGLAVSNEADQASCLASYLGGCDTVTVTDWETCRRKEVTDPCALLLYSADECKEVRRCIGRTDGGPPPVSKDGG